MSQQQACPPPLRSAFQQSPYSIYLNRRSETCLAIETQYLRLKNQIKDHEKLQINILSEIQQYKELIRNCRGQSQNNEPVGDLAKIRRESENFSFTQGSEIIELRKQIYDEEDKGKEMTFQHENMVKCLENDLKNKIEKLNILKDDVASTSKNIEIEELKKQPTKQHSEKQQIILEIDDKKLNAKEYSNCKESKRNKILMLKRDKSRLNSNCSRMEFKIRVIEIEIPKLCLEFDKNYDEYCKIDECIRAELWAVQREKLLRKKICEKDQQMEDFKQLRGKLQKKLKYKRDDESLAKGKLVVFSNEMMRTEQSIQEKQNDLQLLQKDLTSIETKLDSQMEKAEDLKKQIISSKMMRKNKNQPSHKVNILLYEKEWEQLTGDSTREGRKLLQLKKLQEKYESPQILHNLKIQYDEKLEFKSKKPIETKKSKRLLEENSFLKEKIELICTIKEQTLKENEEIVNDLDRRITGILENKNILIEQIASSNQKLQTFLQFFPEHQQEKEIRKRAFIEEKERAKKEKEKNMIKLNSEEKTKSKLTDEQEQKSVIEYFSQLKAEQESKQTFYQKIEGLIEKVRTKK